ncbi:nicotinate-nucleotide--dimethylbenzimidazole phosphoribosyltransferase [Desulfurivibrio sp. D14AmB]|uniref:nicotinate-nucleotide--dimethylbenzimidazole phosphoribosyltransferase n=1 Tax=Desulfurivibrio sp. D14AmB TaxID=3374370 RepID=UPI00376F13E8
MNDRFSWVEEPVATLDDAARQRAEQRQGQLTKPAGSLGRLEELALRLAAMLGQDKPRLGKAGIAVFAGDHGVVEENISAFPREVTVEMVRNFANGGAAISVLARNLGAELEVVNLGTVADPGPLPGVVAVNLGPGTANFSHGPAMGEEQLAGALEAGYASVERMLARGVGLYIGGEMGIGNTTSAAALACAYLFEKPEVLAGPGTGLDSAGVRRKVEVLERALALHCPAGKETPPREILWRLGGFEIAALAGAYLRCAQRGLPVLVDGFISSVAALAALRLRPQAADWFIFSHASAEPGHRRVLAAMAARPLLDLGMRLGEGSGAAVALPLLQLACALHSEMATFEEALVSKQFT